MEPFTLTFTILGVIVFIIFILFAIAEAVRRVKNHRQ